MLQGRSLRIPACIITASSRGLKVGAKSGDRSWDHDGIHKPYIEVVEDG